MPEPMDPQQREQRGDPEFSSVEQFTRKPWGG